MNLRDLEIRLWLFAILWITSGLIGGLVAKLLT